MSTSPVQATTRQIRLAEFGLFYAAAVWGSTFALVKWTLGFVDPFALVSYRFLLVALLMGGVLVVRKQPLFKDFMPGVYLGAVLSLLYLAQTLGLYYTTASNSGFITGLFIVFVPLLSWVILKRRPLKRQLFAVALAVLGLWQLTGGLAGANAGDLITLFSAFTYALHVFLCDLYVRSKLDLVRLMFQQVFVTGVICLLLTLVLGRPLEVTSTPAIWSIIFLTLFPTLSAFWIQLLAQRIVDPVRVSLILTLEPVFAAIFSWTLGAEVFIANRALGGLVIVVAMVVSEVEYGWLRKWLNRKATGDGQ